MTDTACHWSPGLVARLNLINGRSLVLVASGPPQMTRICTPLNYVRSVSLWRTKRTHTSPERVT